MRSSIAIEGGQDCPMVAGDGSHKQVPNMEVR